MECYECDCLIEGRFYYCFHCKIEYIVCIDCYKKVDIKSLDNHPRRHVRRGYFIKDDEIYSFVRDIEYKIFRLDSNMCDECDLKIEIITRDSNKLCKTCNYTICKHCWMDLDFEHEHDGFYTRRGIGTLRMTSYLSGRVKR